ncbi:MAG: Rieske 2Fe-2S domain-containing protein [Pseudomonadota bacterium]
MATIHLPMAGFDEGDVQLCRSAGQEVLVCRVENQFYAVSARCSHAGQLLSGGLQGYEISCPLHGARFDVRNGTSTRAPASAPLKRYPVMLESGKICIDVDER